MSKTQSSVKNDMIASTSWALNASRNACSDGVAAFVLVMAGKLPAASERIAATEPEEGQ